MRFLKYIFAGISLMFMLSSCEKEVIIDLEDSVNVKVQQTIDSYISTLAGAPNGSASCHS